MYMTQFISVNITNNNNYTYIQICICIYLALVMVMTSVLWFSTGPVRNVGCSEAAQFTVGGRAIVIDGARSLDTAHRLLGGARNFHLRGDRFFVVGSMRPCRALLLAVLQRLHKYNCLLEFYTRTHRFVVNCLWCNYSTFV